jgi:hypothetical protein
MAKQTRLSSGFTTKAHMHVVSAQIANKLLSQQHQNHQNSLNSCRQLPRACACRSCIAMGYFKDPILPLLHKSLTSRKPPIINRGTWARHAATKQVTQDFITACVQAARAAGSSTAATSTEAAAAGGSNGGSSSGSSSPQPVCQVVVLGAGSDSSWFNMRQQGWPLLPAAHFIELDYGEVGLSTGAAGFAVGSEGR